MYQAAASTSFIAFDWNDLDAKHSVWTAPLAD
jgi:hypothetical protein